MEAWELNWKRILRWLLVLLAIPYLFWLLLIRPSPDEYRLCELYTDKMNGGIRTFKGKQYNIVLCGLNGIMDPSNFRRGRDDEVRLMVLSMDGELLAERYYEPILGQRRNLLLEYGDSYLIYNDGEGRGFQTKMPMPPTRLDWLRARMPRLWP